MSREYYVCYECREKVHNEKMTEVREQNSSGKQIVKRFHKECYDIHLMKKKNKEELDGLSKYIESDFMFPNDKNIKLTKNMIRRLQSIRAGKIIGVHDKVPYDTRKGNSYKLIFVTFKYNKSLILKAIRGKNFKTEEQKFNYMCAIIENKLPDVIAIIKKKKKEKQMLENMEGTGNNDFDNIEKFAHKSKLSDIIKKNDETRHDNDNNKPNDKLVDKFKDMW